MPNKITINKDARKLTWNRLVQHALAVRNATGTLLINAVEGGTGIVVIALATPIVDDNEMADVLDNHAHAVVGKFRKWPRAKAAAERYARRWLAGKAVPAPPCDCDDIAIATPPPTVAPAVS